MTDQSLPSILACAKAVLSSSDVFREKYEKAKNWSTYTHVLANSSIYIGEAAVACHLMTQQQFDQDVQALAKAAKDDVQLIALKGHQEAPDYLQPRVGRWLQDPAEFERHKRTSQRYADEPSVSFAAFTVARWARQLAILANAKPEIANDVMPAVETANLFVKTIYAPNPSPEVLVRALDTVGKATLMHTHAVLDDTQYAAYTENTQKRLDTIQKIVQAQAAGRLAVHSRTEGTAHPRIKKNDALRHLD